MWFLPLSAEIFNFKEPQGNLIANLTLEGSLLVYFLGKISANVLQAS
jgi:hypothetical protein